MKFIRKGNKKGLDVDYTVEVSDIDDVINLYNDLTSKGYLFMYQKGDIKFDPTLKTFYVLHFIDSSLKLYDFAIFFPHTIQTAKLPKDTESGLDKAYNRAKTDRYFHTKLMAYMKFHKWLTAFRKHLKAYGSLDAEHSSIFDEIMGKITEETGLSLDTIPTNDSLRGLDTRLKHFFDI